MCETSSSSVQQGTTAIHGWSLVNNNLMLVCLKWERQLITSPKTASRASLSYHFPSVLGVLVSAFLNMHKYLLFSLKVHITRHSVGDGLSTLSWSHLIQCISLRCTIWNFEFVKFSCGWTKVFCWNLFFFFLTQGWDNCFQKEMCLIDKSRIGWRRISLSKRGDPACDESVVACSQYHLSLLQAWTASGYTLHLQYIVRQRWKLVRRGALQFEGTVFVSVWLKVWHVIPCISVH